MWKRSDPLGLPLTFTMEIGDDKYVKLRKGGFKTELEKQRERARQSWKGDEAVSPLYKQFVEKGGTQFLGYQAVQATSRIDGIVVEGKLAESIEGAGKAAEIIFNETPFYAESGGQIGDTGKLTSPSAAASVTDTYSPFRGVTVHKIRMD